MSTYMYDRFMTTKWHAYMNAKCNQAWMQGSRNVWFQPCYISRCFSSDKYRVITLKVVLLEQLRRECHGANFE